LTPEFDDHGNPKGKCEECGTNAYKVHYYDKVLNERLEIGIRFRRMAAEHAQEKAAWELDRISITESMKWLQRKVKTQAKAINRLEAKLRALKQKPYADTMIIRSMDGTYTEVEM